jgi:PPOX class probable F420-dependent enzyme
MELEDALQWVAQQNHGILITIRRDGRPQSSDISFTLKDKKFCISATENRAKTKNLQHDNRAVLHVTSPQNWSYISLSGTVEITPPASDPSDGICQELADIYKNISGKDHPDWDEFYDAMVKEQRLVLRFVPETAVGQIH